MLISLCVHVRGKYTCIAPPSHAHIKSHIKTTKASYNKYVRGTVYKTGTSQLDRTCTLVSTLSDIQYTPRRHSLTFAYQMGLCRLNMYCVYIHNFNHIT